MGIGKIRSFLYRSASILGDVDAVRKGTIAKRLMRKAAGRLFGSFMNKFLK